MSRMNLPIKFIRHEPCPSCRSRGLDKAGDNLARYANGRGFCFSCRYVDKGNVSAMELHTPIENIPAELPKDLSRILPPENYNWLHKYLSPEQITKHFMYSRSLRRHVFKYANFWEARSVSSEVQPKSISFGEKPIIVFDTEENKNDNVLYVVEDVISAIKLGELVPTLPLFGSYPNPTQKKFLIETGFEEIVFWLDADKYKRSLHLKKYYEGAGKRAQSINTKRDPKDYNYIELGFILDKGHIDETSHLTFS